MTAPRADATPIVRIEHIVKDYASGDARIRALDDVSLDVHRGEALGIVGETGCGKSTLARCMTRLTDVTSGRVYFDGADITHVRGEALARVRRRMQLVFQDPYGSLNPRHRVGSIIGEPFVIHRVGDAGDRTARVLELLRVVGLGDDAFHRYPAEFSGGQRQRIGIARAIALRPDVLVCDEPVSALDVSIRAQILNLLHDLREQLNLTMVFISHDLAVVRHACDHVAVMHAGRVIERAPVDELFARPREAYTRALLDAAPGADLLA